MKTRFLALAALVLGLASCQNDFEAGNIVAGGEVDFQLSVGAEELATRAGDKEGQPQNAFDSAYGAIDYLQATDATDAYRVDWKEVDLRYTLEVYDKATDYTNAKPIKDRQVKIVDNYTPVVFDLRLVPGREYHFVVFADFVDQGASDTPAIDTQRNLGRHHIIGNTLADITIKADAINNEVTDAYFATKDITITNSAAQDIVLKRPYGKVRVVATDLAELNLNVNPAAVKVEYTAKHPQSFNALTGMVGDWSEETYSLVSEYNEIYKEADKGGLQNHFYNAGYDALEGHKYETADGKVRHTHMTLFTDYILGEQAADGSLPQTPINFTMTVYDKYVSETENSVIKTTTFNTAIPVQRNYLTTVIGNVLTTASEIEVRIDDNFSNDENITDRPHYVEIISGEKTETIELTEGVYCFDDIKINVTDGPAIIVKGDVVIDVFGVMTLDSKGGIFVEDGASLIINGVVETRAAERGGILTIETEEGSAIGGKNVTIQNLAGLTAKANGKHAFGIGAEDATVVIKNTKIDYVAGGHVQATLADDDTWGKKAPEGGAAIGGASITIENSEIVKAEGGSKAAAIGNKYWAATNIVIKNSTLGDIFGGNASAAIGGSRYNKEKKQSINIVIEGSTIANAVGGTYGAGIGSGYDTYCATNDSNAVNNIEISTSTITAKGGKYAAGIGTGHHAAALTGSIDAASKINATSGDESYCDESGYGRSNTVAQGIGYGSVDANCEFKGAVVTFTVAGKVIDIPSVLVTSADDFNRAMALGYEYINVILGDDITVAGATGVEYGGADTKMIVIDGNGKTLTYTDSYRTYVKMANAEGKLVFKDMNLYRETTGGTHWHDNNMKFCCNTEFNNVKFNKGICYDNTKTFVVNDATITKGKVATYGLFITAGCNVTIDGLTIDHAEGVAGRGIKIVDEDVKNPTLTTLKISNSTFKTAAKAAILVGSSAGADITVSNLNIAEVAEDSSNEVWVDEDYAEHVNKVNVVGGSMIVEGQSTVSINDMETLKTELTKAGEAGAGYTVLEINADINMEGQEWTPIKVDGYHGADIVTIDGKGHTITGLEASLFAGGFAGGSGIVIKNLTIANSHMVADNTQGYGAFVNCADSMDVITLINCHLKGSEIITPNSGANESRIGGLVGWTAGYNNQNDGPVDSYITIENCSVIGCTFKGAGSIGAICGHAGANAATFTTIKNCTITNNTLISTDDGGWRTGVVVGTANNGQCKIINITESGNTLTQTSASDFQNPTGATRHYYGRFVPAGTGSLEIDGVTIVSGKTIIAEGVYKTDADNKFYQVESANGLVYVADNGLKAGEGVKLAADINFAGVEFDGLNTFHPENNNTFDGQGHTVSNWTYEGGASDMGFIRNWVGPIKNIKFENCHIKSGGRSAIVAAKAYGNIENVTVNNCTIEDSYWACGIIAGLYNAGSIKNCTVTNSSIKSNGGTGGIVGVINESAGERVIEGCSVSNTTINNTGAYGAAYSGGALVGMFNADNATYRIKGCTVSNNTLLGNHVFEKYPDDENVIEE